MARLTCTRLLLWFPSTSKVHDQSARKETKLLRYIPLVFLHDGRSLVVLNLGVRVDSDNQVVAHSLGLTKGVEVTYKIEEQC